MWKRVLLGVVFAGLIGVLAVGAISRTINRTASVVEAQGRSQGRGSSEASQGLGSDNSQGSAGRGYRGGSGDGTGASTGSERGSVAEARGSGAGQQASAAEADANEWLTLQGTVVSLDEDALVVETTDGTQVVAEGRPWSFAQEQAFEAQVGDEVSLAGFYEDGEFKASQIENLATRQTVLLREDSGRPMWAGGGRGRNR